MKRTRLSFFYLISYLWLGGFGLLIAPQLSAALLQSNADYPDIMLRALGMFMIGIGIIIVQIVRYQIEVLYPTTLIVRLFFCVCLLLFFFTASDPLFLVLLGIVGLGLLLTGSCYLSEKGNHNAA